MELKVERDIEDMLKRAFVAGYEKRVCEELQKGLDGEKISSSYNQEKLNKTVEDWYKKQYGGLMI